MSEKRGATVKLEYPFNTAACLEVQLPNGKWYRITCNEFRSYTYPRRISQMREKEYVTEEYIGPVYLFGTNTIVNLGKTRKRGLLYPNNVDPRKVKDTRAFGRL